MSQVAQRLAPLCVVMGLVTGCAGPRLDRFEYTRPQMGTLFRVVMYAPDRAAADAAAEAAFARIDELNATLSDYLPDSELSGLSKSSGSGRAVPVGGDLWTMLERSQQISEHTHGAFDVTVGPLVRLWRRARRQRELPPPQEVAEALQSVGHRKIVLDPGRRTATLTAPGMRLDLGGIAKGFACDEALKVLRSHGIRRAMVVGGGDVVAGDAPPGEEGWVVEIAPFEDPQPDSRNPEPRLLLLRRSAVSTSGDAFQFVEIGGRRYSHIVDPRTGLGLTTPMRVTVVARHGSAADAYATALNVLGPVRGLKIAEQVPGTAAIFVSVDPRGGVTRSDSSRVRQLRFVDPKHESGEH